MGNELIERANRAVEMLMRLEDKPYFTGGRGPSPVHEIRAVLEALLSIARGDGEVERLREAISEAIKFLGMDRPIDPREMLLDALAGETPMTNFSPQVSEAVDLGYSEHKTLIAAIYAQVKRTIRTWRYARSMWRQEGTTMSKVTQRIPRELWLCEGHEDGWSGGDELRWSTSDDGAVAYYVRSIPLGEQFGEYDELRQMVQMLEDLAGGNPTIPAAMRKEVKETGAKLLAALRVAALNQEQSNG